MLIRALRDTVTAVPAAMVITQMGTDFSNFILYCVVDEDWNTLQGLFTFVAFQAPLA